MTTTSTPPSTPTPAPSAGAAVRGGSVALAGQAAKLVLQVGGLVVLGRLVSPHDFGLVAMVMAVLGIAEVFRDLGLSSAAIQAETLSRGQKNNLFWINTGLGLVLSGAAAGVSVLIAAFYGDPTLTGIALALSVMFLLNGLQTQFMAELARQLRFVALAGSDVAAAAGALALAVGAALLGWGYWALVVQIVAQSLLSLVIKVVVARWWPGWPNRSESVRGLVRYGWNLMLTQTLIYLSSNLDKVLIGSRFGPASLGLYSRAMQIVVLPTQQLFGPATNVALPVLSRLRSDPRRFAQTIVGAQLSLGYPIVFALALAVALADPLLPLVMGRPWAPTVPLFRLLAVSALFQIVNYVIYWVFLAQGKTASHFRYSLISRSILVVSIVIGSTFSVEGVAIGYVIGVLIPWPIALWWVRRWSLAPVWPMFVNGLRVIVAGLVVGGSGLAVSWWLSDAGVALRLIGPAGAVLAMAAALALVPAYRADFLLVIRAAGHLRPSARRTAPAIGSNDD